MKRRFGNAFFAAVFLALAATVTIGALQRHVPQIIEALETGQMARKILEDGANTYICTAEPGTAYATRGWQIKRVNETGTLTLVTWADGDNRFDNVATDPTAHNYQ